MSLLSSKSASQSASMATETPTLEILLPVHNEGASIRATVEEMYEEISQRVSCRFIFCEDGSVDDTKEVLTDLARSIPAKLLIGAERKGYSRAVIDGMKALEAPFLLCLDSDGQCDPRDFWSLWEKREQADLILGWRVDRADNAMRRLMSRTFYLVYQLFFRVPAHDPSCPYVLVHRKVIADLVPTLGAMRQGFWWEFVARVHRGGYSLIEVPVHHRLRSAGVTQVYQLSKLPGIGYRHFLALFRIWRETRT
jgi:dolichol-phosphate mannosyltransferase